MLSTHESFLAIMASLQGWILLPSFVMVSTFTLIICVFFVLLFRFQPRASKKHAGVYFVFCLLTCITGAVFLFFPDLLSQGSLTVILSLMGLFSLVILALLLMSLPALWKLSTLQEIERELLSERKQNLRFSRLLASSPAIVFTCGLEDTYPVTSISNNVEENLGYTAEEFNNDSGFLRKIWLNPPASMVPPEEYKKRLQQEGYSTVQFQLRHKEGHALWFEARLHLLEEENRPNELVGVMMDITERMQTEQKLQESEAKAKELNHRLDYLLENSPSVLYTSVVSDDYPMTYCSSGIERMLGYSAEYVMDNPLLWQQVITEESLEEVYSPEYYESVVTRQGYSRVRREVTHHNGERRVLELTSRLLPQEEGKPQELIGVMADVTLLVRMEKELQEERQKALQWQRHLERVDATSPALTITALMEEGYPTSYISSNVKTILGYEAEVFLKSPLFWHNLIHPDELELLQQPEELQSETDVLNREVFRRRLRHKNGTYLWFDVYSSYMSFEESRHNELVSVLVDVTSRVQAEKELRAAQEMLGQISKTSPVITWIYEISEGFPTLFVTDNIKEILGYSSDSFTQDSGFWKQVLHSDDFTTLPTPEELEAHLLKEDIFFTTFRIRHKNGEYLRVEVRSRALSRTGEGPTQIIAVMADVTEHHQTMQQLQQEKSVSYLLKEQLEFMVASSPVILFTCLVEERYPLTYISSNLQRMLGYPASIVPQNPWFFDDIMHPADLANRPTLNEVRLLSRGERQARFRHAEGHYLWMEIHFRLMNPSIHSSVPDSVQQVVAVMHDVTERRVMQMQLQKEQIISQQLKERLEFLIDSSPAVLINARFEEGFPLSFVSRNIEGVLGYSATDFVLQPRLWKSLIHPDDLRMFPAKLLPVKNENYSFTLRCFNASGQQRWLLVQLQVLNSKEGKNNEIVGVFQDITQRKEMEIQLEEDFLRTKALLDAIPDEMIRLNLEGEVLYHTQPHKKHFQADSFPRNVRELLLSMTQKAVEQEELQESTYMLESGSSATQEFFEARAVKSGDGEAVCIIRDLTSLKRTEQALQKTVDELAHSNRELEEFAYVASHDLKAPLRAIRNLILLLQRNLSDELEGQNKRYMELIDERAGRLQAFLDGLLAYSRVGRKNTTLATVNSKDLVQVVLKQLYVPDSVHVTIEGDFPEFLTQSFALQQVLLNLLANALNHANPEAGEVRVSCRRLENNWVEFSVQDNGGGIAPRFHERIFQLFETLESRDKGGGTGIGLAIVKKTVNHLGGTIRLESAEGEGACFKFTWPLFLQTSPPHDLPV
jgi:PAS domain S-box-containing protein